MDDWSRSPLSHAHPSVQPHPHHNPPAQGIVTRTNNSRIDVALSSFSSVSGGEEEDVLEAWGEGHERLRLDMLANETTHRRMVEVCMCVCIWGG